MQISLIMVLCLRFLIYIMEQWPADPWEHSLPSSGPWVVPSIQWPGGRAESMVMPSNQPLGFLRPSQSGVPAARALGVHGPATGCHGDTRAQDGDVVMLQPGSSALAPPLLGRWASASSGLTESREGVGPWLCWLIESLSVST